MVELLAPGKAGIAGNCRPLDQDTRRVGKKGTVLPGRRSARAIPKLWLRSCTRLGPSGRICGTGYGLRLLAAWEDNFLLGKGLAITLLRRYDRLYGRHASPDALYQFCGERHEDPNSPFYYGKGGISLE